MAYIKPEKATGLVICHTQTKHYLHAFCDDGYWWQEKPEGAYVFDTRADAKTFIRNHSNIPLKDVSFRKV